MDSRPGNLFDRVCGSPRLILTEHGVRRDQVLNHRKFCNPLFKAFLSEKLSRIEQVVAAQVDDVDRPSAISLGDLFVLQLNQRIFGVPVEKEPAFEQNDRRLFELLLERLNVTDATRQSPAGVVSVARVEVPAHIRAEQDRERRPVVCAKTFVQAQFVDFLRCRSSGRLKR